jgi:FkbM family methyltransferase
MLSQGERFLDRINILRAILFNSSCNIILKNSIGRFHCNNRYEIWSYNYNELGNLKETLKRILTSEDTFLDVGANIGAVSFLASRIVGKAGKVYSFEPENKNLKTFQTNINLNNIKNIGLMPLACTEKSGYAIFNVSKNPGEHSLGETLSPLNVVKQVKVKTTSLDDFVKKEKIKKIKLIKIDVEGQELGVLMGAKQILKRMHPIILFECWNKEKFEEISKFFNKYGYKIKRVTSGDFIASREGYF